MDFELMLKEDLMHLMYKVDAYILNMPHPNKDVRSLRGYVYNLIIRYDMQQCYCDYFNLRSGEIWKGALDE